MHVNTQGCNCGSFVWFFLTACVFVVLDRCKCKLVKLNQKTYTKNNYNYGESKIQANYSYFYSMWKCIIMLTSKNPLAVIRARVKEIKSRGHDLVAVVEVKDVLKSSLVHIPRDTVTLHYSSGCLCPVLTPNKEYVILGYENEERSRCWFFL